jgi:hypothetical protein
VVRTDRGCFCSSAECQKHPINICRTRKRSIGMPRGLGKESEKPSAETLASFPGIFCIKGHAANVHLKDRSKVGSGDPCLPRQVENVGEKANRNEE